MVWTTEYSEDTEKRGNNQTGLLSVCSEYSVVLTLLRIFSGTTQSLASRTRRRLRLRLRGEGREGALGEREVRPAERSQGVRLRVREVSSLSTWIFAWVAATSRQ